MLKRRINGTHQVLFVHAVYVWANDGEVLHPLRWGSVGYVHCDLDVVADGARPGLEAAWKGALGQLEPERKRVATSGEDG